LVIPSTVIFQKCFAPSAEAVRRVLRGELHKVVDRLAHVAEDLQTYFLEVFKEIRTQDVYAYANLMIDPQGITEYDRLRRTLTVAQVNEARSAENSSKPYLNLGFPFTNLVDLKLHGIRMRIEAPSERKFRTDVEYAFFVTEIVHLSTRLVFDRLIVHRKNSGSQAESADDESLMDGWIRPPGARLDIGNEDDVFAESEDDPVDSLDVLLAQESGGYEAVGLEVVDEPRTTQRYKARATHAPDSVTFSGSVTTGDTRSGTHGAVQLDIGTEQAPNVPTVLQSFLQTLRLLRLEGSAFTTIQIATLHSYDEHGDVVNYFPRKMRGVRRWHLLTDIASPRPRGYVVAMLSIGGVCFHLIELERKGEESRSLAVLSRSDGRRIEPRQLLGFMADVAQMHGWWKAVAIRPAWSLRAINHNAEGGPPGLAVAVSRCLGLTRGDVSTM